MGSSPKTAMMIAPMTSAVTNANAGISMARPTRGRDKFRMEPP